jgi:hypothetical protein
VLEPIVACARPSKPEPHAVADGKPSNSTVGPLYSGACSRPEGVVGADTSRCQLETSCGKTVHVSIEPLGDRAWRSYIGVVRMPPYEHDSFGGGSGSEASDMPAGTD